MKRLLIGALAVVVGGCATAKTAAKSDVTGTSAAEYYPLKIGNSWTYDVKFLGQKQTQAVVIEKEEGGYFVANSSSPEQEPPRI